MRRVLIVPAAGLGSRLKADRPKALVEVNGRTMLDHLADLYRPYVDRLAVIAHPSFSSEISRWARRQPHTDVIEQPAPTGMLDAILLAVPLVSRDCPDRVWITWCDQVGVLPATLVRLAAEEERDRPDALILPTVWRADPYIHFVRDGVHIVDVLQRREGDDMPAEGETDMGVFALSRNAYEQSLSEYSSEAGPGRLTGERNFLPFIAWLARRDNVITQPCTDPMEAIGINTQEDLRRVARWLQSRMAHGS